MDERTAVYLDGAAVDGWDFASMEMVENCGHRFPAQIKSMSDHIAATASAQGKNSSCQCRSANILFSHVARTGAHMTLDEWLDQEGLRQLDLALRSGISQSTISTLKAGGAARSETYERIFFATDGNVTPNDILPVAEWTERLRLASVPKKRHGKSLTPDTR